MQDYGGQMPASQASLLETINAAYKAGFHSEAGLVTVTSIAIAESGLYATARHYQPQYGPNAYDRGLWQISNHWFPQYSDAQCDDPAQAAAVVYSVSAGGTNFAPWDAYENGSARVHYDEAVGGWPAIRPVVRRFLAEKS